MSDSLRFGQKGPNRRMRITRRLTEELLLVIETGYDGKVTLSQLGVDPALVEPLRLLIREGTYVSTGHTMNLGVHDPAILHALVACMKAVERFCAHHQVKESTKRRRRELESYLGVSAVDRLANIAKPLV